MAFAGAMDLLTMTIPNRISVGLAAAFFVMALLTGLPPSDILMHVAAGLVVLAAGIVLYAVGGFGGGDAKLLAAGALWIGLEGLLPYLLSVTIFGGLLAFAVILYRRVPVAAYPVPDWALRLHAPGSAIPYGIAIAAAALYVYPKSSWFIQFWA